jgi:hypothetical protein
MSKLAFSGSVLALALTFSSVAIAADLPEHLCAPLPGNNQAAYTIECGLLDAYGREIPCVCKNDYVLVTPGDPGVPGKPMSSY